MSEQHNGCIRTIRRRQRHPTPVLLPGESHGWRSLVGCSPWGSWGSHTTERLHFHFSFSCTGEGNGNPLQCSCLENPRDGGAWWAAIYGVTQSRTRLKWLSSKDHSLTRHWKEWHDWSLIMMCVCCHIITEELALFNWNSCRFDPCKVRTACTQNCVKTLEGNQL